MTLFPALLCFLRALFTPRLELVVENLALRQQLAILHRTAKLPKLRPHDRFREECAPFWIKVQIYDAMTGA